MPTHDHKMGVPIDLRRTGACPCMILYALDELFYVFQGVGSNYIDEQCIVACDAYPRVVLTNVNHLEHLAWAVH